MKVVETDGFKFRFSDAVDAFVFDEEDSTQQTFHGVPMKAVDIVAEFEDAYVYIELKDYSDPSVYDVLGDATDEEMRCRREKFKWLKNYLKYKFRDSYLYRHAEQKVEKPVHYVCLITLEDALNSRMQELLQRELPVGKASYRWVRALAESCSVVNVDKWNESFPKWSVERLPEGI